MDDNHPARSDATTHAQLADERAAIEESFANEAVEVQAEAEVAARLVAEHADQAREKRDDTAVIAAQAVADTATSAAAMLQAREVVAAAFLEDVTTHTAESRHTPSRLGLSTMRRNRRRPSPQRPSNSRA